MNDEKIVISLGGSLIVPGDVDTEFLREFVKLIESQTAKGRKFVIITGGGKICRNYQEAAKKIKEVSSEDLDWLGIYSTRFNAEFIKLLFSEHADKDIITNPELPISFTKPIILGGGQKPGGSTDLVAVLIARNINAKKVINLSNIDYAYDKDPNIYPDAKKIEKISWAEYRALIPKEWNPGLSTPFDPIASELAQASGMEVAILNGKNISNLSKCLNGEDFVGTKIK